jgi:hypothetical protein
MLGEGGKDVRPMLEKCHGLTKTQAWVMSGHRVLPVLERVGRQHLSDSDCATTCVDRSIRAPRPQRNAECCLSIGLAAAVTVPGEASCIWFRTRWAHAKAWPHRGSRARSR